MNKEHHVIIIPGMGNEMEKNVWVTKNWTKFGIKSHVFNAHWRIQENGFKEKLDEAILLVDDLSKKGRVSIIGSSAGGSFALNLFGKRKNKIHKIIINCGRVRQGAWPWFDFNKVVAFSPSFYESILMAEKTEAKLTNLDKQKILTLCGVFDEIVPPFTILINGTKNETIPAVEHMLNIALAMTIFRKKIVNFILS